MRAERPTIDPIAQFLQEHDQALSQLASLTKATRSIESQGFAPEAYRKVLTALAFIDDEVSVHNRREEEALFPVLERYVEGPTRLMRDEHRLLRKEFRRLRTAARRLERDREDAETAREFARVSRGMVQLFVNHIHKENYILFPLVQKFLTKDALREVARRML
jgi:hemerythrin-like domain-containing protein